MMKREQTCLLLLLLLSARVQCAYLQSGSGGSAREGA